jgi:hypothetical protein
MIVARVIVGIVAAMICIAGIGWYAVYLFSEDPRKAANPESPGPSSPMKLHPALARRENKRSALLGCAAVLGGLVLIPEALESIRTGIPIHVPHNPDLDGWTSLAIALFVVVLGAWLAASGLLKMRKRQAEQ